MRTTGKISLWMHGEARLWLIGELIGRHLPPNALQKLEQIPSLVQVFLAHCIDVHRLLPAAWPKEGLSEHLVSGIWIGLAGRAL